MPAVGCWPLQPPDAVHDVALVEDQLRVVLLPAVMLGEVTDSCTVGDGPDAVDVSPYRQIPAL